MLTRLTDCVQRKIVEWAPTRRGEFGEQPGHLPQCAERTGRTPHQGVKSRRGSKVIDALIILRRTLWQFLLGEVDENTKWVRGS